MQNEISWEIWRKWDQPRPSTINRSKVTYFEKKKKPGSCKSEFYFIFIANLFSKWVTFEPLMVDGHDWSEFLCLFKEIPFCISFLKKRFSGSPVWPDQAVGIWLQHVVLGIWFSIESNKMVVKQKKFFNRKNINS